MPAVHPTPRFHALIPCAGTGSRAGTAQPKQYQSIAGQAMVMHTVQALTQVHQLNSGWLILSPQDDHVWPQQGWPAHFKRLACGGASRAESVFNGLQAMLASGLSGQDWVLVHDAARCLITPRLIQALLAACANDSVGGLLALPLPDTLKASVDGRVSATLNRSDKWLAQTPQMFRLGSLAQALEKPSEDITDEASAMEAKGFAPLLIEGASFNFKVTYPQDWALAEVVLNDRKQRPGVLA